MTKRVHPNTTTFTTTSSTTCAIDDDSCAADVQPVALTVWKKSLLMNCSGFTVFDGKGNLIFRVDNYLAANKGEIVLMDAAGKSLLTIRRKRLSWGENWLVYDGEASVNPRYLVQKQGNLLINPKTTTMSLAQVFSFANRSNNNNNNNSRKNSMALYQLEGSYAKRSVVVYNNKRQPVAEIKRKETTKGVALGGDVFSLIIQRPHDIDSASAMALVILLDQMFGSS